MLANFIRKSPLKIPRLIRSASLDMEQQCRARETFAIFKQDPIDPRLRPHRIHKLSARYARTIYAVEIEADLRVVFYIERDVVVTVEIGSHDVYR